MGYITLGDVRRYLGDNFRYLRLNKSEEKYPITLLDIMRSKSITEPSVKIKDIQKLFSGENVFFELVGSTRGDSFIVYKDEDAFRVLHIGDRKGSRPFNQLNELIDIVPGLRNLYNGNKLPDYIHPRLVSFVHEAITGTNAVIDFGKSETRTVIQSNLAIYSPATLENGTYNIDILDSLEENGAIYIRSPYSGKTGMVYMHQGQIRYYGLEGHIGEIDDVYKKPSRLKVLFNKY